jgi:hypothetical protein
MGAGMVQLCWNCFYKKLYQLIETGEEGQFACLSNPFAWHVI